LFQNRPSLSTCRTLGALKEALRSRASCEPTYCSLPTAFVRSLQRSDQALSSAGLGKRRAPKIVISAIGTIGNDCSRLSFTVHAFSAINSHFDTSSVKPNSLPTSKTLETSLATVATGPPMVKSSKNPRFRLESSEDSKGCNVLQNSKGPMSHPAEVQPQVKYDMDQKQRKVDCMPRSSMHRAPVVCSPQRWECLGDARWSDWRDTRNLLAEWTAALQPPEIPIPSCRGQKYPRTIGVHTPCS